MEMSAEIGVGNEKLASRVRRETLAVVRRGEKIRHRSGKAESVSEQRNSAASCFSINIASRRKIYRVAPARHRALRRPIEADLLGPERW